MRFFRESDGYIYPVGDSVTAGGTDETGGGGYPIILTNDLSAETKAYWSEITRYAVGGYAVADIKAGIDADLAGKSGTPTDVLILLGTNDVTAEHGWPIAEATWKADYNYILDAIHTTYNSAKIYLGYCYRSGYLTELTTLAGWINDMLAERDYCYAGIDAYALYDGHPELLSDGLHPNYAGFVVMAAAWKTILGY